MIHLGCWFHWTDYDDNLNWNLNDEMHELISCNVNLKFVLCLCNSFLTASFRSHARRKELYDYNTNDNDRSKLRYTRQRRFNPNLPLDDSSSCSPDSSKTFGDTQLEIFHHRHGLLILHLLASLMFVPSLIAWFQVWIMINYSLFQEHCFFFHQFVGPTNKLTGGIHFCAIKSTCLAFLND